MDVLDSYKIDLKNMRTDVAEYQFALDDAFFEAVEGTLVKSGKADADLKIRESGGAYVFTFHIKGTVHVPCDRCLDDMDVEIETERMLTVKLGVLGYKTASKLYEMARIETTPQTVECLDDLLFHHIPYVSDYI